MTIKIQPPNALDKIAEIFGKKRAVYIPEVAIQGKYGVYVARRENILRVLLRPKNAALPKGWQYSED